MKRRRIVIKGKAVQDIGYLLFLYEHAEEVDIIKFRARNIEEGMEILVGGDESDVDKFVVFVRKERPERAEVKEIEVEAYEGKIKPIERFAQSFMLVQMGKFVNIGLEMLTTEKEIKKDTGMMLEKQDMTLEKQDMTLEKQGMTLEKQDMTLEKQDKTIGAIREVSEKIDRGKEDIVTEIRSLREDLKAYMEERFERVEREIWEIKAKIGLL
jgi:acylphosphatase